MKALLHSGMPAKGDWLFEVKLDGIRAVAVKQGAKVQLFSRRPRDITANFPDIAEAVKSFPAENAVLDGEVVALDPKGRSSFQLLQNARGQSRGTAPLRYYIFDIMNLEGRDVMPLPLTRRKDLLRSLMRSVQEPLRLSDVMDVRPAVLWAQIQKLGLEGVIAKQRNSAYEPDRRSGAWIKVKTRREQEFVIGGYSAPEGARQYFGALLVGYYEGDRLLFASKVGTGFNTKSLQSLYHSFQKFRRAECPFVNLPARRGATGIGPAEMRKCVWLEPRMVCQVGFMEWTQDGNLRHPVFIGLREDKKPEAVVREREK